MGAAGMQDGAVGRGNLVGFGALREADGQMSFSLSRLDLDAPAPAPTITPMPFFGHAFAAHPRREGVAAVFEKRGPGACEMDLATGEVLRPITTAANRQFYGHGAYAADGSLLYCTETVVEGDYEGLIAVRDADSLEELGRFPSYGASPHDCHLVDEGRTMYITNGGGPPGGIPPSVTVVDVASGRLLAKHEFDAEHVNAGHMGLTADRRLVVISAEREGTAGQPGTMGGISVSDDGGGLHTLTRPQEVVGKLVGETLSLAIDERHRRYACTTPEAHLLSFWDLDSNECIITYRIPDPKGVTLTLDQRYYAVSYLLPGRPVRTCLSLVSTDTLQRDERLDVPDCGMSGSHIDVYTFPPRPTT